MLDDAAQIAGNPARPAGVSAARRKTSALLAIGVGAILGGTVDLIGACLGEGWDIPLYVAAGLLGRHAIHGGVGTYIVGVLCHFVIVFSAATIYYFTATLRLTFLKEHPLVCGLFYGMAIELFMRLIVLPLSGLHAGGPYTREDIIRGLIGHMAFVGLPIAFSVWRFAPQTTGQSEVELRNL